MAEEKAEQKKIRNELAHKRAKKISRSLLIASIILFALGIAASSAGLPFVFYMLVIGMTPAILSYIIDIRPGKAASKTIIAFNLAGISQPLNTIINAGSPNQAAEFVLKNPEQWILAYGFAAFGMGVIYLLPHMANLYLDVKARYLVSRMKEVQDELEKEWGEEVKK